MQSADTALPFEANTPPRPGARPFASYAKLPPPLPEIGMRSIPGVTGRFRTVSPYPLALPDGSVVIIPEGFESDLASVPRVLWGKVGPHELGFLAPVGHDYLLHLRSCGGIDMDREEIDDVFDALLERQRVAPRLRRQSAWAVRLWTRLEKRRDEVLHGMGKAPSVAAMGVVIPALGPSLVGWRVGLAIHLVRLGVRVWRDIKANRQGPQELGLIRPHAGSPGILRRIGRFLFGPKKPAPVPTSPRPLLPSHGAEPGNANLRRWRAAEIRPHWMERVKWMTDRVKSGKARYQAVAAKTRVPWEVIGVIHAMESGCRFDRHLHNGDPLTARTVRVPAGRPETGEPPFTWEESAIDALNHDAMDRVKSWDMGSMLDAIERYNGLGYRYRNIPSPYLWSGTDQYVTGKFVRDGVYDSSAVSKQVGAAAILIALGFPQ